MLLPSEAAREEGCVVFEDSIPTSGEWEAAMTRSYGTAGLAEGDDYDVEYIARVQVRHQR